MDSNLTTAIVSASGSTLVAIVALILNNHRFIDMGKRIDDMNKRFDDLIRHMDQRFDAMEKLFTEKLYRVEQVMDARIKHLEENEKH